MASVIGSTLRANSEGLTQPTPINALQPICSNPQAQATSEEVAASVTMKELNKVKESMLALKKDVALLFKNQQNCNSNNFPSTCHIFKSAKKPVLRNFCQALLAVPFYVLLE